MFLVFRVSNPSLSTAPVSATRRAIHGLRWWIPQWWAEEGGRVVTFGSDDHGTDGLAAHFPEATALLEQLGFHPGRRPEDPWTR